jgi:osmotically-inducible protein OsmY
MTTDSELKQDVIDELMWEPDINATEIGVAVKDGIVTLSGYVDTYHEKLAAERAAQGVSGVKAVVQETKVRLPGSLQRSDEDIAKAAANALAWTASVPHDRIKVKVQNGWITLSGQVDWRYQRDAAEDAVCNLMGVVGVSNQITVKPSPKPTEIKTKIESAFQRNALLDARRIDVHVRGDRVILEGSVRSYAEKKEAEQVACSAPGICEVENRIAVNP